METKEQRIISSREADTLKLTLTTKPVFRPSKERVNGKGMTRPVVQYAELGSSHAGIPLGIYDDRGRELKARVSVYVSVNEQRPIKPTVGELVAE